MEQNAEQNLVQRAKRGDAAAVAELFRLYWRAARAAAFGVTGDFALAEDAASEAFYAAIESLPDLRDTQRFGPWLRTIVVRTARRQKAKAAKENGAELQTRPDGKSQPPGADLERQELVALIHEAVGHLSESLREAVVLFYFEGYSLKEAAGFLDVPEGTLKRRLHEGRQRLREAAERILKGTRAMNAKREQILQQLKDAVDEGIQSESFFQAMRQALRLRPAPHEMLRKAMQKHWAEKKKKLPFPPEKERMLREALGRIYGPSERAKDPNHPVGAASDAIRAALPEFEPWQIDLSQVDVSQVAQRLFDGKVGQAFSFMRPPGLTAKSEGSYITGSRAWLVQDQDGRLCTSYELIQRKASGKELKEQMHQGNKLSDTLFLWKEAEALELRDMEDLLRRLAGVIVPEIPVQFCPYEEPRYRAGLRMQLGDNPIPAAIGGVHNCWPGLPEGASFASILIYLESWAAAQSGQVIELMDFSPSDFFRSSGE